MCMQHTDTQPESYYGERNTHTHTPPVPGVVVNICFYKITHFKAFYNYYHDAELRSLGNFSLISVLKSDFAILT